MSEVALYRQTGSSPRGGGWSSNGAEDAPERVSETEREGVRESGREREREGVRESVQDRARGCAREWASW